MGKEKGRAREGRRKIKGGGTGRERTKREREGKGDEPPPKNEMSGCTAVLIGRRRSCPAPLVKNLVHW